MNDKGRNENAAARKQGDAAWKQQRELISDRNEQARKAGRARRAEQERLHALARHAAERRDVAAAAAAHPAS